MTTPLKRLKGNNCSVLAGIVVLSSCLFTALAQSPPPQLRLERHTNAFDLTVSSLSATGALFIYQAADLQTLVDSPALMFGTNTVSTNDLRVPIAPLNGLANQAFFFAANWPGLSTNDFGDPENYPDEPLPAMILLTSGVPTNLVSGQAFTADFFITDPAGQLLSITQAVSIRVLRESDGVIHPDAQVSPTTGQLIGGHLRLTITITATKPLDGYTLGLGPAISLLSLNQFLKTAFNLGPNPLDTPTREALLQILEQRRTDNADAGPSWNYPLAGSGHPVSGTFGEWRGKQNKSVHRGLDLAAGAASTVVAARGGVVSSRGTLAGMGDYLVVDHGGGWFSRYLHLDAGTIPVRVGQAVARGATLATGLYAVGNWPQHLHFEIRQGANQAQWNVGLPGSGQDPLQTPGIFAVPPGTQLPQLKEIGLTRSQPGENAFVKAPPNTDANGPVYLFAKFLDLEGGHRLGLRAMRFQPESPVQPVEIRPQNDAAVGALLPPGTGAQKGFARYNGTHAANPDPANYYRYWWQWDTSSYATNPTGPRSFVLTGENYSGAVSNYTFNFGPQIKSNSLALVDQQYWFTNVAYLGTNTIPTFVQPDQYKLEVIQTNGQALEQVTWSGQMDVGDYTKVFSTHLEETVYAFTLPGGTSPDGLKLRVSSRLAPDVGHEAPLPACFVAPQGVTPVGNMVWISCGTFTMGSPASEPARYSDEVQHRVTLSQGFWMGKYAVTQGEYLAVMGSNPSYFQTPDLSRPVETVSWNDAVAYCAALTAREQSAGRLPGGYVYRLPTEAEREYACRAGTTTPFHYGNELRSGMANFYGYYEYLVGDPYHYNSGGIYLGRTTSVGSYAPNAWGLYDMHGNVWEWCQDWYSAYPGGSVSDPQGPASGSSRVVRGGSWNGRANDCRSAYRYYAYPTGRYIIFGFRVVLAPGQ